MNAPDFDLEDVDPYAHMPGALRLANDVLLEAGAIALRVDAVIDDADDLIADLMRAISSLATAQEIVAGASRRLLDHTEKVAFA